MANNEEIVKEIREGASKDTEFSRDLAIKFYYHWSLLSGAAISLFIPFLSSDVVQNKILPCSKVYVHITFLSFILSILLSTIRNFLMMREVLRLGQAKHQAANDISELQPGQPYSFKSPRPRKITEVLGYVAIAAFILGIVSTYIFISKVILSTS